jgi:hypothetical protein
MLFIAMPSRLAYRKNVLFNPGRRMTIFQRGGRIYF